MGGLIASKPPTPPPPPPPPAAVSVAPAKVSKASDLTDPKGASTDTTGTSTRRKTRRSTPSLVTLDGSTNNPSILGN